MEFEDIKWWAKPYWWVIDKIRDQDAWWNEKRKLRNIVALRDRTIIMMDATLDKQIVHLRTLSVQHEIYEDTLLAIIAEEKPTSNATVKRICNMARVALK